MVKAHAHTGPVRASGSKPLAGAVYKRQRRTVQTAPLHNASRGFAANGSLSGAQEEREGLSRPAKQALSHQHQAVQRHRKVAAKAQAQVADHRSRPPLQPVAPHHGKINWCETQAEQAAAVTHPPAWGLSQEAAYFAELDSEELLEDVQDSVKPQGRDKEQKQAGHKKPSSKTKAELTFLSQHASATPDALELVKYHPELQAKYDEYVQCMESSHSRLTPMPLEDFCRLAGKELRGLPVLNT